MLNKLSKASISLSNIDKVSKMHMFFNVSWLRSHYPEVFGIRRELQRLKVKRIRRYTLPESIIQICENKPEKTKEIIIPYLKRWKKYLLPIFSEMEMMVKKAPIFSGGRKSLESIKTDILFCRLAYGFLPSEYVSFGLMNKLPELRKSYASDLDVSTFGYTVNNIVELQKVYNKGRMVEHFKKYMGRDIIVITSKTLYKDIECFVENHPVFVKKKIFSCKGKDVEVIDINNIGVKRRDYLSSIIQSGSYMFEELVTQSSKMAIFNNDSVNTVRVRTFNTRSAGVKLLYCNLRTGRLGSFVDNGGAGGLLIGVDEKTGIINSNGFDEYGNDYTEHPDSHVSFRGYQLPDWDKLVHLCKSAAEKENDLGYLSWDMAYTEEGWKIIEVNEVGQFVGAQVVSGKGLKKDLFSLENDMKHFI